MKFAVLVFLTALCCACVSGQSALETQRFVVSTQNFPNPERGFYQQEAPLWLGTAQNPLSSVALAQARLEGVSLLRLYFLLDEFVDKPISSVTLEFIRQQFTTARLSGMKIIPRFAYNFPQGGTYPYKDPDASLPQVLAHIAQLEPVLQQHADVIAFMELGFIGAWGEWHSSTNNLVDAEPSAKINDASKAIVGRLLQALPSSRMVAMRYPPYKQQFYGSAPLTSSEAFSGSPKSRMGAHNDCFLASETDWGTYPENATAREALKNYLAQDNQFLPQGGETCNIAADAQPFVGCTNAIGDLERLHYTALNRGYLEDVYKLWQQQGCLEEVKRRLGYRFVLQSASFPSQVQTSLPLRLELQNQGFATPYNPRGVALVLRRISDGVLTSIVLHDGGLKPDKTFDPRFWTGTRSLETNVSLPNLSAGKYELFLHLFDPEPNLKNRPEYAIRFANQNVWDAALGMNKLGSLEVR
jgi:hypothetical protein